MNDQNKPGEKPKLIIEGDWKSQAQAEKQAAQKPAPQADADRKLSVDDDWKAQARAEKEKLAEELGPEGEAEQGIPPADFRTLASTLVSQALFYMGAIPDPATGQRMVHLELAKHQIDLLGVLEVKTKGNLDAEEAAMVTQSLQELRTAFVQLAKQVQQHMAQQKANPNAALGGGMGGGGMGGAGPIRPR